MKGATWSGCKGSLCVTLKCHMSYGDFSDWPVGDYYDLLRISKNFNELL